jgi:hypothetical protein
MQREGAVYIGVNSETEMSATYGYGPLAQPPVIAPKLVESGLPWGDWNVDELLRREYNPDYLQQVIAVFDAFSVTKEFDVEGEGFYEAPGVIKVEAHRVTGQVLYDKLVSKKPEHWFHRFYLTDLLKLTRDIMEDQGIYPFLNNPDDAYTGNAQYKPHEKFPMHRDTRETVSAWVNFSRIHPKNGGQLILSFGDETRGRMQLQRNPGIMIFPHVPGDVAVFDGQLIHGSNQLTDCSEPRRIIACSYWRPGYRGRSKKFKETRQTIAKK